MTEETKEKIKNELARLQDELNLLHWKIQIAWEKYEHQDGALAETRPNVPYCDVVISIYPAFENKSRNWEDQKSILRHELCHVVLAPFVHVANERFVDKETFMDVHELVTSQLEKIITRLSTKCTSNLKLKKQKKKS